jgi:DNA repair ATPase RecN
MDVQLFSKIENDINHLNSVNVTRAQMRKMANKYFKIDGKHDDDIPTKSKNGRDRMLSQFHHETLGTFGQSAWDAMNAYTAYMSHDRPTRDTKGSSKEENQWRGAFSEKDSRKFRNIITEVVGV